MVSRCVVCISSGYGLIYYIFTVLFCYYYAKYFLCGCLHECNHCWILSSSYATLNHVYLAILLCSLQLESYWSIILFYAIDLNIIYHYILLGSIGVLSFGYQRRRYANIMFWDIFWANHNKHYLLISFSETARSETDWSSIIHILLLSRLYWNLSIGYLLLLVVIINLGDTHIETADTISIPLMQSFLYHFSAVTVEHILQFTWFSTSSLWCCCF